MTLGQFLYVTQSGLWKQMSLRVSTRSWATSHRPPCCSSPMGSICPFSQRGCTERGVGLRSGPGTEGGSQPQGWCGTWVALTVAGRVCTGTICKGSKPGKQNQASGHRGSKAGSGKAIQDVRSWDDQGKFWKHCAQQVTTMWILHPMWEPQTGSIYCWRKAWTGPGPEWILSL